MSTLPKVGVNSESPSSRNSSLQHVADESCTEPDAGTPSAVRGSLSGEQGAQMVEEPPREGSGLPVEDEHQLQDQTNLLPVKKLLVVFAGLSCALFCSLLDQTIVSTALPTLGRVFNDASMASWVGTSYLLTSTAFQPLYGRLSDIFGRKVVIQVGLSIFLVGSILCAVSQNMTMLIVFRALSGVGGGGIVTLVMIVVSDVVSLEDRGKYQGIIGVVIAASNAIGPLLGGVFTEKASWRWCFYINIPLTSIAMLVVAFFLPLKRVKGDVKAKLMKIDYLGAVVMLASSVLVLLPLSWGGTEYAWDSAGVLAPLIIGAVLFVVFLIVELKAGLPLIPLHIFENPTVAGAYVGSFFTGVIFYCNLYYLPQFYQVVRGDSPVRSGVMILPLILVQTVTSFTSGFLTSKTGNYQIQLWLGFAVWAVACGLLSTISPSISTARLVGYQILSGIGAGQTFQTGLIAIQASVARKDMAVATGTRNFLRLLGGTMGLAVCAAILNNTAQNELAAVLSSAILKSVVSSPTQISAGTLGLSPTQTTAAIVAYTHGIRNVYYFMTPCACVSFFATVIFVRGHSLKRDDDAKLQEEGKEWAAKHGGRSARKEKPTSVTSPPETHTSSEEVLPSQPSQPKNST